MDTIVPGALAAFVVDCSIFPLDTIKSRVQAADFQTRYPGGRGLYRGLWQGFGPVVIATLPSAAIFFTTYEHAKETLGAPSVPIIGPLVERDARFKTGVHMFSSALAELSACLILTPAETIKQQRQVSKHGMVDASFLSQLSVRSLWRGYWALVGRNLPFTAIQFPLYESFRAHLSKATGLRPRRGVHRAGHHSEPNRLDDVQFGQRANERAYRVQQRSAASLRGETTGEGGPSAAAGAGSSATSHYAKAGLVSGASAASAGAISALVTTPLDLIKTRIMLGPSSGERKGKALQTTRALALDIWRREGLRGLMRGAGLRSTWTAMGAGIYLGSYEAGREWWGDAGKEQAQEIADKANDFVEDVRTSS